MFVYVVAVVMGIVNVDDGGVEWWQRSFNFLFLVFGAGFSSKSSSYFRFPFDGFLPATMHILGIWTQDDKKLTQNST